MILLKSSQVVFSGITCCCLHSLPESQADIRLAGLGFASTTMNKQGVVTEPVCMLYARAFPNFQEASEINFLLLDTNSQ